VYLVKYGGSLLNEAPRLLPLFQEEDVLIVPGGGVFADAVRQLSRNHSLSDEGSHRMAIRAMDLIGLFLSDLSGIPSTASLADLPSPAILLPSRILEEEDPFPASWEVTSDSIAAYFAWKTGADRFLLLKAIEGVIREGRLLREVRARDLQGGEESPVDPAFPRTVMKYRIDCTLLNGRRLKEPQDLHREGIGTRILWR
jgi:hypothetical protein